MKVKINIEEFGSVIYPLALGRRIAKTTYDLLNIYPIKFARAVNNISPLRIEAEETLGDDFEFPFKDEKSRLDAIRGANIVIKKHNAIAKEVRHKRFKSLKPYEFKTFSNVPIDYPLFDPFQISIDPINPVYRIKNGQNPVITSEFLYIKLNSLGPSSFVKRFNKSIMEYLEYEINQTESTGEKQNLIDVKQRFITWFKAENLLPNGIQGFVSLMNILTKNTDPEKTDSENDLKKENRELNNEISVKNKKIIELREQKKQLILIQKKPTKEELIESMDESRFKSSKKVNCSKVGKEYGKDHKTIKSWIQSYGLSKYAFNPD